MKEGNLLKNEFLDEFKISLQKHNQDLQEKINLMTINKMKIIENTRYFTENYKNDTLKLYKSVLIRTSASKFISNYMCPFIIEKLSNETFQIIFTDYEKSKDLGVKIIREGKTINDFIEFLLSMELSNLINENEFDIMKIGKIYNQFLSRLKNKLNSETSDENISYDDKQEIYQEIESHVCMRIHEKVFEKTPTKKDLDFYNKLFSLQWIKPTQLGIEEKAINFGFWQAAVKRIFFKYFL